VKHFQRTSSVSGKKYPLATSRSRKAGAVPAPAAADPVVEALLLRFMLL
jgi:hypothetical protein